MLEDAGILRGFAVEGFRAVCRWFREQAVRSTVRFSPQGLPEREFTE